MKETKISDRRGFPLLDRGAFIRILKKLKKRQEFGGENDE